MAGWESALREARRECVVDAGRETLALEHYIGSRRSAPIELGGSLISPRILLGGQDLAPRIYHRLPDPRNLTHFAAEAS